MFDPLSYIYATKRIQSDSVVYSPTEPEDKTVIWFDTNTDTPKIYDVNENKWRVIGGVVYSSTEPSDKSVVWFDTNARKPKIYDNQSGKWGILKYYVIDANFDNNLGGTWSNYINIPISRPSKSVQYKIEINGDNINVYSNDGTTVLTTGTGGLDFWNKVQTDGKDIRVFDETSSQNYFWVEKFDYANRKAIIWVRLNAGQEEVNIAYGNDNCITSKYNNGDMTFEFFDDFNDGVVDAGKWVKVGNGTVKEENGYLEIIGPGDVETNMVHLFTTKTFTTPCIVETKVMLVSGYTNLFFFAQSQAYQTSNNTFNLQFYPSDFRFAVVKDGFWSLEYEPSIGKTIYANIWYRWQTILKSDKHITRLDDCAPVSWTPTQSWTSGYMALKAWKYDHCRHDWFFIRRYLGSDISFGIPTIKEF